MDSGLGEDWLFLHWRFVEENRPTRRLGLVNELHVLLELQPLVTLVDD